MLRDGTDWKEPPATERMAKDLMAKDPMEKMLRTTSMMPSS
jgi:hypothetical protein